MNILTGCTILQQDIVTTFCFTTENSSNESKQNQPPSNTHVLVMNLSMYIN